MKKKFLAAALAGAAFAAPSFARDTVYRLPLADVLAMPEAEGKLNGSVKFYLAGQATPKVVERKGEGQSNRKTNGVGKDDTYGCKWAALSALIALQEQAVSRGANAVVDLVSYYRKNVFSSPTEYECHAGNIVIGVTFKGQYATVSPELHGAPALWLDRVDRAAAAARGAGLQWLSPAERSRLQGMASTARQAQFLAGRFVARALLAALHGGDPLHDWPLSADAFAPPRLLPGARLHDGAVCLSISHSGEHVACAVDAAPIGVDVEWPRRRDLDGLAAAVCTPAEQAELAALEADARRHRFYAAWTLKEAFIKQRGEGVSVQRMASLDTVRARGAQAADGWSWDCGAGVVALAARSAPARLLGDACALGAPLAWTLRDLLTSP